MTMSDKNDNFAVKLLKKSVGLPTGSACGCGTPTVNTAPSTPVEVSTTSQASCCGTPTTNATPSTPAEASRTSQACCGGGTTAPDSAPVALSPEQIHQVVRERYGEIARVQDAAPEAGGCCSSTPRLYSDEELAELPTSVAELSLGCGNPVSEGDLRKGDTVLDLGSGGGIDCFLAAKRVGPAGHVIGIDMTPEMLERARASAARLSATNVEFRQGQIEALPVADGEVDVVISNCVINLSPNKPQVFREMFRALKPGGRVSVSDIVTNGPMSVVISQDLENWAACVAGASEAQAYCDELEAAGFVDISIRPKDGTFSTLAATVPEGMPFSALISARKPQNQEGL
jgi:arsenite methyltransferase